MPKNYVFSNMFDVASTARPWEKVAVAKNMEYVLEVIRAEGTSEWRAAPHDEFALVVDGEVVVDLLDPDRAAGRPRRARARWRVDGEPAGTPMGRIVAGRGHMALLPAGRCYRFTRRAPERDPAPDHRGPGHRLPLGRDLPDRLTRSDDHDR